MTVQELIEQLQMVVNKQKEVVFPNLDCEDYIVVTEMEPIELVPIKNAHSVCLYCPSEQRADRQIGDAAVYILLN